MKSTKSWLAAALVAAFIAGGARVGEGSDYNSSKTPHEITLVLYVQPGSLGDGGDMTKMLARLQDWKGYFESAADVVWNYTKHQAGIKEVQVYRLSKPSACNAEVHNSSLYTPNAHVYNGGQHIGPINLPFDINQPKWGNEGRTIGHEMGHGVFGCSDEYKVVCSVGTGANKMYYDSKAASPAFVAPGNVYSMSPHFKDLYGKITGTAFQGNIEGPHTIMNESDRWDVMSTPNQGTPPPWNGAMHYGTWEGGLSFFPNRVIQFETYQQYRWKKSAWERMEDTRGLQRDVVGRGSKPKMEWRLMDGSPVVLIVLDSSGSMDGAKWRTALNKAKSVVLKAWLAKGDWAGDCVGVITFADKPTTKVKVKPMKDKKERSSIEKDINGSANGGTKINAALEHALDDLKNFSAEATGPECIILLSDGQSQDTVTDATLNALKTRGVKVNTVSIKPNADEALMKRIATATGGKSGSLTPTWRTSTSAGAQARALMTLDNLSQFFDELYAEGRDSEQMAQLEGVASGTSVEQEFVVDSYGDIDLTVNLYWETGDMDVALVKPDGTVIERAAAEAAETDLDGGKEQDSAFIRVNNPEAGTWKVRVVPAAGSGEQAYLATVSCTGRDNMRMYAQTSGDSLTWPAPLLVSASFGGAVPAITGAVVTAVATCPDGTEVPFELNDDGVNGDEEAGDGVYAAEFTEFTEDGQYRFDIEGKNISGRTCWRDYSPAKGGELPDPEPVEPFVRRKSLTVQYDGLPEFINATRYTGTEFASWTLNRNTGAMTGSLVVSNQPSSRKTLIAPFWYAVTETVNVTLAKVDGYTDDGDPYVNITDKVEAALMAKYGRKSMAPGEWVAIDGVEVYSRDRSIPDMTALWSLWADPPAGAERRIDSYDRNANGVLDDEEILLAVEHWEALDMDDEALLKRIALWKQGEE